MTVECFAEGGVAEAPFRLKVHRGEGMALLAMDWRRGRPPNDFVGFAIEYAVPGSDRFWPLKNRLTFEADAGTTPSAERPETFSTLVAPIQKWRWVHFPRDAELPGDYSYRVTPMRMARDGGLSRGVPQTASLALARETVPGVLNVAFTRGFVSSQAFVDRFGRDGPVDALIPGEADDGLTFQPTHPGREEAYAWMGFEARRAILALLDEAAGDRTAEVGVVAFDLNLPEIVERLERLGSRARVIVDDSRSHVGGAEDEAARRLEAAGVAVKRQHMAVLQHNKTAYVAGHRVKRALCGSTNMSWRGLYVQSNNAVVLEGDSPVAVFKAAFDQYWDDPDGFARSASASWTDLGLEDVQAQVAFSPHARSNSVLAGIGEDVGGARSSVLYSLAFLSITPGVIREAIAAQTGRDDLFVAGISDQRTGIEVAASSSNLPPTFVAPLGPDAPPPFSEEPKALTSTNGGTRMHHKFIVLDFDTPDARVYLGSYNMSKAADGSNGENLVLVRDRRVATSYMVEALRMIDHYQWRAALKSRKGRGPGRRKALTLRRPPSGPGEAPWWLEDFEDARKVKDRGLFAR